MRVSICECVWGWQYVTMVPELARKGPGFTGGYETPDISTGNSTLIQPQKGFFDDHQDASMLKITKPKRT